MLGWFAQLYGGVECKVCVQTLLLLPAPQEWQLDFLVFLYFVHNLPQLSMGAIISSPL